MKLKQIHDHDSHVVVQLDDDRCAVFHEGGLCCGNFTVDEWEEIISLIK